MAVGGLGKELAAGVLDGDEGLCGRCCVPGNPADTFIGRVIDALVRDCDNLAVVGNQVTESPAAAAAVTGNPGDTTIGGVFDAVVGRVDSDQLVAVCD